MVYVLDTNIILRLVIRDDETSYDACRQVFEKIKNNTIKAVVPGIVLAEVLFVLKFFYGFSKEVQIEVAEAIQSQSGLKIVDSYDYQRAIELYKKTNVKYVDCLIATTVQELDATVISYDADFGKLLDRKKIVTSMEIV
jgi:predicted nucleic acid-binding protein